jgi:hypothetical protein
VEMTMGLKFQWMNKVGRSVFVAKKISFFLGQIISDF